MNACTCACTQYKGLGRKYRTVQSFRKSFKTKHVPGQPAGLALRGLNEDIGNGARTSNVREQASTQPMQHAWLASLPVQISYITTYVKPFPAVSYIYIFSLQPPMLFWLQFDSCGLEKRNMPLAMKSNGFWNS